MYESLRILQVLMFIVGVVIIIVFLIYTRGEIKFNSRKTSIVEIGKYDFGTIKNFIQKVFEEKVRYKNKSDPTFANIN